MAGTSSDSPHGYLYGDATVPSSPVTLEELAMLKTTLGWTADYERYLKLAGEVLADQTRQVVAHWRSGIIAGIPHLARHSRSLENDSLPEYLAASNLRFEQWILDTCLRPYDQDWLNYQHEIALRHTTVKKNQTDGVSSTPFVPYRDVIAFTAVMNQTIKPYLAAKGHSREEVDRMHDAWCKSLQLQIALWGKTYMALNSGDSQW
jgi:hypothetical protein